MTFNLRHRAQQWGLLVVQMALMAALCGFFIALADRHNRRYDLTPYKTFVISDQSKKIALGVAEPTRILVFFDGRESGQRRQMADILEQFATVSPKIEYRLYDLDRTPGLAKKYDITGYSTGVVENSSGVSELPSVDEISITTALLRASRDRPRELCFITGHGEHSPMSIDERGGYSDVAKELETEHFVIRRWDLVPPADQLQGCTVVVLAGPRRDFLSNEADLLAAYLSGGGKVLLLTDPESPPTVVAFLERFGLRPGNNLIVDERNRLYGADAFMARVPIFDEQTFRARLDLAAVFALAQSLEPAAETPEGLEVSLVALSSPDSWAQVGTEAPAEDTPRFRPDVDLNGPLPVAVMVSVDGRPDDTGDGDGDVPGKLIVFGDSDFASNLYLNLMGNKDLFMSTVGLLAEDDELVAVRRKRLPKGSFSPIYLTARQGQIIFTVAVIVVPATILALGAANAFRRRRQGG